MSESHDDRQLEFGGQGWDDVEVLKARLIEADRSNRFLRSSVKNLEKSLYELRCDLSAIQRAMRYCPSCMKRWAEARRGPR